jgi:hypothetical protein
MRWPRRDRPRDRRGLVKPGFPRPVNGRFRDRRDRRRPLDALAAAHCREIIVETASTRGDRPELGQALGKLQADDTLAGGFELHRRAGRGDEADLRRGGQAAGEARRLSPPARPRRPAPG